MDNQDKVISSLQKIQNDLNFIKQKISTQDSADEGHDSFKTIVQPKDSGPAKLDGNIETI